MNIKVMLGGLLNLIVRRYLGPFWYRRYWLAKTERLSRVELDNLQLALLKKIVRHCYETVPWYKDVMERNSISLNDLCKIEDIKKFPILTKADILSAGSSLVSTKYPKWFLRSAYTGGTTGTPVKLFRSLFSIGNEHAFVRRQWEWAGIGLLEKCAYLTGRIITNPNEKGSLFAYDPFMKELVLSTYHLSDETALSYVGQIKKHKIMALVGYPSAIYLVAKFCIRNNISLELKSVMTSSETLTLHMRETIQVAFGAKIYDFYGSAERVCYIFTCEKGSYHINPEYGLTELIPVDDSIACKKYKVVSTGFWNFAMPFIRYDTGDIVTKSDKNCGCGRKFQVIESIEGRVSDEIKTISGRVFGAALLTHLLYGVDNIIESQIVQTQLDFIEIRYVPGNDFGEKNLNELRALVKLHLPDELAVEYSLVDKIERTVSGKFRPVVSIEGR